MSSGIDGELLAERAAAVLRHLDRVAEHLPDEPSALQPMTATTDTVVLHLWQAVQVVIDLAVSSCVRLGLGSPTTYADAFRRLAEGGTLPEDLATRLGRASAFRNLVVHGYGRLDLQRVHAIARDGPADLRTFLAWLHRESEAASGTERP
ncbi:MAG: DUF86 domain-containing protein [Actinomycetota bacterium]|jgi:uncharacterized protein YutE (UPF0331/DUF86 family)|nr:DUF86 domain-containing protein [Actinomycetota bacterium]